MALRGEAKREYQRAYMRRRHGFAPRGVGKGDSKGNLDPTLDPHIRGDFRPNLGKNPPPSWVSDFPNPFNTKSAKRALEYMAYINARGYTVDMETGEMKDMVSPSREAVPQAESLAYWLGRFNALHREHELAQAQILSTRQRLTLVEAELAALQAALPYQRADAILDDQRRELREEEW